MGGTSAAQRGESRETTGVGNALSGGSLGKIGLFGGTFNPIHNGHLAAAAAVWSRFGLDRVILIPSASPPHKDHSDLEPAAERLAMARIAARENSHLSVSDVELVRTGPSYSIDTVRHFQTAYGAQTCFFFLVGLDAFLEMDSWRAWQTLFGRVDMIVFNRPGTATSDTLFAQVGAFLHRRISGTFRPAHDRCAFVRPDGPSVYLLAGDMMAISSTYVRRQVKMGGDISTLVPSGVADYIFRKGLYR